MKFFYRNLEENLKNFTKNKTAITADKITEAKAT